MQRRRQRIRVRPVAQEFFEDEIEINKFELTIPKDPKDRVFEGGEITTPQTWLNKWKPAEDQSRNWMKNFFFEKNSDYIFTRDQSFQDRVFEIEKHTNSRVYKDIENLAGGEYQTFADMAEELFKSVQQIDNHLKQTAQVRQPVEEEYYICQYVRTKWNRRDQILDEAIMMAILYEVNKQTGVLYIYFITRFWQGIDFLIDTQGKTFETYRQPKSDGVFSKVMTHAKEVGAKFLKIELATPGSRDLLLRRLLPTYFKSWHKEPRAELSTYQWFPMKYLTFQLCNTCIAQIATVGWENRSEVFCGKECALQKWNQSLLPVPHQ